MYTDFTSPDASAPLHDCTCLCFCILAFIERPYRGKHMALKMKPYLVHVSFLLELEKRLCAESQILSYLLHDHSFYISVGSPLSGWLSDRIVINSKQKRGYWYPEDRLRTCLYSFSLPLIVLASGFITTYLPTRTGLVLNLIFLFINGMGVRVSFFQWIQLIYLINFSMDQSDFILTPCGAYVVDVLHANSAEVTAAVEFVLFIYFSNHLFTNAISYSSVLRALLLSSFTALLLPLINRYGLLSTNTLVSLLAVSGIGWGILSMLQVELVGCWPC